LHIPTWQAALSESLLAIGSIDEARETIDRGLALAENRNEKFAVPLLLRLKGIEANRRGDVEAAQTLLQQAIAVAREQGARLYQVRAAVDLAHLMERRGHRVAAHGILAEACCGLEGGAGITSLAEARELLSSLI